MTVGTCISGVLCLGAREGWSRLSRRLALGRGPGAEHPWAAPLGNHPGPSKSCSSAGGGQTAPKSLRKHPAVPAPHRRQVLAPAPPSSGRLCTVKGRGDPALPSQPPAPSCSVGICPAPAHATGTRLPGTFADLVASALATQPQRGQEAACSLLGERAPPASLGTFSGHRKMQRHKGAAVLASPSAVPAPSPGSAVPAAGRAAAGSGR